MRNHPSASEPDRPMVRAAQYIRMSTEHQQYSTENQGDIIKEYAEKRGFVIVKTYADEGKSGLRIEGRDALRQLIDDVMSGVADYKAILVYDISRWGRFQDTDESAYYEYVCRRAGIAVVYCAEQFENDGSPVSTIIKGVKRAMAGEYSRELSAKVFKGQCKLIQLGFRQGGPAGYGLRRMLVDQNGDAKGVLKPGEHKSIQTDRVVLVPGPDDELKVVRWIYQMFIKDGLRESEIAARLNDQKIQNGFGRPWTRGMVNQILTNEKYVGNNVYNRVSFKLKKKRVCNPPDMWIRSDGVFEPIVDIESFFVVRGIIQERNRVFTDEELLDKLRNLIDCHGKASAPLIDDADGMPSSTAYRSRFGSLIDAYRRVGYIPDHDFEYLAINRRIRSMQPEFVGRLTDQLSAIGATVHLPDAPGHILINGEYSAGVILTRCKATPAGALRWLVRMDQARPPDITVVARLNAANKAPWDFFLLPLVDITSPKLRLGEFNGAELDTYKFDSLDFFVDMALRERIEEVR